MTSAGLQAGFGGFLGAATLESIREQGFSIVRIDCQLADQAKTVQLAQEVIDAGLQPLVIIRRVEQLAILPEGALAEAGNEPDIREFGWASKREYRDFAVGCAREALRVPKRLYVGVVSNLHDRGFDWLRELPWDSWPPDICCSVHRYSTKRSPLYPHKGSKSRDAEVATLRAIIGPRPIAVSETGYALGEFTEAQQAEYLAYERQFWARHGADFVVAYQVHSGPGDSYGLRKHDGTWRPAAAAFTGAV